MPVYNAEKWLTQSVNSILGQTLTNWELIIVNDGSTDGSAQLLEQFSDPRIRVLHQANAGVSAALNKALEYCNAPYIARQDADDVSKPDRLLKTFQYLEENESIGLVGCHADVIDEFGNLRTHLQHPTSDAVIRYQMLWDSAFVSSTTMFRKSCIDEVGNFYTGNDRFVDFDMWSRISKNYRLANIPEALLYYRELTSGLSHVTKNSSQRVMNQRKVNIGILFPDFIEAELVGLARSGFERTSIDSVREIKKIFLRFNTRFKELGASSSEMEAINKDLIRRLEAFQFIKSSKNAELNLVRRIVEKIIYKLNIG
jgi:glycosyltransferase involved in cell wall biosynthesis